MSTPLPYHQQKDIENVKHLRQLVKELPRFCGDFFRGIEPRTSSRTRIAYAYDLRVFFDFLLKENPVLGKLGIQDITLELLDTLRVVDIEEYMEYLKYRFNDKNHEVTNKERGIMRKISSLKSFYNYYYRNERIQNNPASLIQLPKLHEKDIIRLDVDEVALLLDQVESGETLTEKQKAYHAKTKVRDLALLTLMLGTGIRVSECVGLDLEDIDFKNGGIRIHRKGGKEVTVYFGSEVEDALIDYLEERNLVIPEEGHEKALFLSLQKKRIAVRSVENLVKKYSRLVTPLKKITPHKLRSTYGTSLYKETGDIYLVADVLGHSDVNTTKKHYAALEDERRRSARNKVKLRES
ncbi:tyrosine-type recombinase/integrase [Lachnospiraceae bacterium 54-53]